MQTTTLGPFTVSRPRLGAMLMGGDTPADQAHRMLDRFPAAGGTLVDTADTYGDGASERALAPWLARHHAEVVVAPKVRFAVSDPGGAGPFPGPDPGHLRREPAPAEGRRDRPVPGARTPPCGADRGHAAECALRDHPAWAVG